MTVKGRFITVEGIEGVGKSTNVGFIERFLRAREIPLFVSREPGGTPLAEEIRAVLLGRRDEPVIPMTELLLMFAARSQHVAEVVRPKLAQGIWVLCDRFVDSSFAYQGAGRGVDRAAIDMLVSIVLGDLKPDLTILLDVKAETGLARARETGKDRFESEDDVFFERVRQGFLDLAELEPDRFEVIDTTEPLDKVEHELERVLTIFLEDKF